MRGDEMEREVTRERERERERVRASGREDYRQHKGCALLQASRQSSDAFIFPEG